MRTLERVSWLLDDFVETLNLTTGIDERAAVHIVVVLEMTFNQVPHRT